MHFLDKRAKSYIGYVKENISLKQKFEIYFATNRRQGTFLLCCYWQLKMSRYDLNFASKKNTQISKHNIAF